MVMNESDVKHLLSYTGSEPCIVAAFSAKDARIAAPFCLKLQRAGYRLQFFVPEDGAFDAAVSSAQNPLSQPGKVFLFIVSAHFPASHDLRQLMNTAFLDKHACILLLLDEFSMMPSFKLQMKAALTFYYRDYDNEDVLLSVLGAHPLLQPCRQSDKTVYYPKDNIYRRYYLLRKRTGEKIAVSHSGFKIGRQKDACDYTIEDNAAISRIHAVFDLEPGVCTVRDNASTNRVYLNNSPLCSGEERVLGQNDLLELGSEQFTVIVEDLQHGGF